MRVNKRQITTQGVRWKQQLTQQSKQGKGKQKKKANMLCGAVVDGHGCRLLVMMQDGKWHDRSN